MINVLHVDDEPDFLEVAREFLELDGEIKLTSCTSAGEVLEKNLDFLRGFGVIVSDYQMPGVDGLEFLNAVKRLDPEIPFILFTGKGREEVAMRGLNAGAEFYLTKGGDPRSQFAELANMIVHSAERRQARISLEHNAKRFRQLIENASDMISVLDERGFTVYASPSTTRILGYLPEELIGKSLVEIVHPDDLGRVMETFAKIFSSGSDITIDEARIRHKNGSWRLLEGTARLTSSEEGSLQAIVNTRDVTERKRAKAELEHANSVLRTVVDVNRALVNEEDPEKMLDQVCRALVDKGCYRNAWIALVDNRDRILLAVGAGFGEDWNELEERLRDGDLPACLRKALGHGIAVLVDDRGGFCGSCPIRPGAHGGGTISVRLHHAGTVYGVLTVEPARGCVECGEELDLLENMAGDIGHALKSLETEDLLAESEESYRAIFHNTGTIMVIVEQDGTIALVNEEFCKLMGTTREDVEGKRIWTEFIHPDDLPMMTSYHKSRRIDPRSVPSRYETRVVDGLGGVRNLLIAVGIIPGTSRSIASAIDITEQKKAERPGRG